MWQEIYFLKQEFGNLLSTGPDSVININKKLDEQFLVLLRHVAINDTDFLSLTVEDPFFNRMTDITDVL